LAPEAGLRRDTAECELALKFVFTEIVRCDYRRLRDTRRPRLPVSDRIERGYCLLRRDVLAGTRICEGDRSGAQE
jgi:hypothetical protein